MVAGAIAVNTLQGSMGGGMFAVSYSWATNGGTMYSCSSMCASVLSGLVAVTGSGDLLRPWDSFLYGFLAAGVTAFIEAQLNKVGWCPTSSNQL